MAEYISLQKNAAELMKEFEAQKKLAVVQKSRYRAVLDWFKTQYPKYKELPDFGNNAPKVIDLAAFQKKQEEKKAQAEQLEKKDA